MDKFIGRKPEIKILKNIYDMKDAFVMVTGMRHVGKSALVRYFCADKPTLFFTAREISDSLNRRSMMEALSDYYHETWNPELDIPDWPDLCRIFSEKPERDRRVLVIDNVGYLIQANPLFPKLLKQAWEKYLQPADVVLILIFSNNSVLSHLEEQNHPLLASVNLQIRLQPVTFIEMLRDYPHRSYAELVSLYSITGGMPLYWSFFNDDVSTIDQLGTVRREMLPVTGWFYDMPLTLLEKDIWEPMWYVSVLQALALGRHTAASIAELLDYKQKDVLRVLSNLEILGYVKSEVSVTEKRFSVKKARYRIASPLLDFWFSFVYPQRSLVDGGNELKAYEVIKRDYPTYIQPWFADISRDVFLAGIKQKSMDFICDKIGSIWNDNQDIPIAAIDNRQKKLFLADTHFSLSDYPLERFERFIESCENCKELARYKSYERIYGLFTVARPSRTLMDYVLEHDNIVLFTGVTLYRKNTEAPVEGE